MIKKLWLKLCFFYKIFVEKNHGFFFSCLALLVIFFLGYFGFQNSRASLNECVGYVDISSTLNTTFPPNNCEPVPCSSLTATTAKTPNNKSDGKPAYNCYYSPLYYFDSDTSSVITPTSSTTKTALEPCDGYKDRNGSDAKPRINCADIIDLPLCSILSVSSQISGVNCVSECGTGQIHNTNCIKFCTGSADEDATTCVAKKCHQLTASETPSSGSNCNILTCDLLAMDELKVDSRFSDSDKQYCDGTKNQSGGELKCYNFAKEYLPYVRYRDSNKMCQIHDCPPTSVSCAAIDDSSNISKKGTSYQSDYQTYINGGMDISTGLCKNLECKPIIKRYYRCTPESDSTPTTLHSSCDTPQTCSSGFCTKTIDCNLSANSNELECISNDTKSEGTSDDVYDAWFYRPEPYYGSSPPANIDKTEMCYSTDNMRSNGWGGDLIIPQVKIGDVIIFPRMNWGYFHNGLTNTRSPAHCTAKKSGLRGVGYGYLCGTDGDLWSKPDNDVGYIKGIVGVDYSKSSPEYSITACLRYKNSGRLNSCGSRKCGIDCAFGSCPFQWCGFDVCREMKIDMADPDRCSITNNSGLFTGDDGEDVVDDECESQTVASQGGSTETCSFTHEIPSCLSNTIDDYVRMRARKYGRKICVFIDETTATAYEGKNYDGSEVLEDGITCVEGDGSAGSCGGKNTNDAEGEATKWRTVKMIRYIGGSPSGYVDLSGQFFKSQDCIKVPLRVGAPRFYNIATSQNSINLFEPPLYILNSYVKRGGAISIPGTDETLGTTDFYQPEIEVQFGSATQKLSLGAGYSGGNSITGISNDSPSESYSTSPWEKTNLTSSINGQIHTANIFIAKEYYYGDSQPILCLYRRTEDDQGQSLTPIKVGCVDRLKPKIRSDSITDTSVKMMVKISDDSSNPNAINPTNSGCSTVGGVCVDDVRSQARLKLKLIYDSSNANSDCSTTGYCSSEISFKNNDVDSQFCTSDFEKYQFCSKRDDCSKLVYECSNNQIDINNAIASGTSTSQFDSMKTYCQTTLLANCNKKLGISSTTKTDFLSQLNLSETIDTNYQNFQSILTGATVSTTNRYGWFNEICIVKGFEDKLKSIIAYKTIGGVLGKCVIDTKKSKYLTDVSSTTNCDAGGKAPYCVCQESTSVTAETDEEIRNETPREAGLCLDLPLPKVCTAINYETPDIDVSIINSITNSITADTTTSPYGYYDSVGVHTSHKERSSDVLYGHAEYSSTLQDSNNIEGTCNGFWQKNSNSQGVQLKPLISCGSNGNWGTTQNACIRYSCSAISTNLNINIDGTYENSYTIADDITNSIENKGKSNGFATWSGLTKTNDFLQIKTATACLTGFKQSGNSLPTRYCKQNGVWDSTITNACERISCSAINPSTDEEWTSDGGASFSSVKASRRSDSNYSTSYNTRPESISTGTCNNEKGFWKLTGSESPTVYCKSNGEWETNTDGSLYVKNPCSALICNAIGEASSDSNAGYAIWPLTKYVTIDSSKKVEATGCKDNYIPNPNVSGSPMPSRYCNSVAIDNGYGTVWGTVTNPCIDQCPAGNTTAQTSTSSITIYWPATDFGKYSYQYNCLETINASEFASSTSHCYLLRRLCGDGTSGTTKGLWYDPVPMCVGNGGQVGNATYSNVDADSGTTNINDALPVGGAAATGACATGYGKSPTSSSPAPQRQCVYVSDLNHNIDQVYWGLANSTQDCKKLCSVLNVQEFGNAYYNSTSGYIYPGESIDLTCKTGYLSALSSGSRSGATPKVTCGSDGTWGSVVDDCSAVRSCDDSSSITGSTSCNARYGCAGFRYTKNYSLSDLFDLSLDRANGFSVQLCKQDSHDCSTRTHIRCSLSCSDGTYTASCECNNNGC